MITPDTIFNRIDIYALIREYHRVVQEELYTIEITMLETAGQDIYATLFDRIVGGDIKAGERLKEIALSKEFGISRTPVRDALRQLANDGLAEIAPAQGARVVGFTADDVEDVYDIRMALELLAVDLAGPSLRLQRLAELKALIEEDAPPTRERQAELDAELHQHLIEATGRRYLIAMYEQTSRLMQRIRTLSFREPETLSHVMEEHAELIEALLVRDVEAAKRVIRRHIQNSKTRVLSLLHRDS